MTRVDAVAARVVAALARVVAGGSVRWIDDPTPTDDVTAPDRPRVFYANHTSHLDAAVVWAFLPHELRATTRPVAAADYWRGGRVRPYLANRVFRALLIDRVRTEPDGPPLGEVAVARMTEVLDAGDSLLLFPEGTRGDGREIAPFRSGLFHLWRARPDVELVPVRLDDLARILPKGTVLPVPLTSRVTFGAPFRPHPAIDRDAFAVAARAAVLELDG